MIPPTNLLSIAETAATDAAEIATEFLKDAHVLSNSSKDIKTLADIRMNKAVTDRLDTTRIPVLSEEIENDFSLIDRKCWIVDPLDGTYNFSRKYPCAAVSICLWEDGSPVTGIVKDIFNKQSYTFLSGKFARLGNEDLHVSTINDIGKAMLATGFPSGGSYDTDHLMKFVLNIQSFKKIRSIGSASLMLSHVASGIFDVYYENDIYLWDVAAGLGLVENAGGKYYIRRKGETAKYEVLASNALIFEAAKTLLINN